MSRADAAFYFDLASPYSYLIAEQVLQRMPIATEWQPVSAGELPAAHAFAAFRCRQEELIARAEVQRQATVLGLLRLRWPEPCPFDGALAMRAATYAKSIGRVVAFAQAAFRQAYAGGHSLDERERILIAAAACEMHPTAVLQALERPAVAEQLAGATERALALGVREVPSLRVGGEVFSGERVLERAAAYAEAAA